MTDVVRLRHVEARATEYDIQQSGDPIDIDVELAEGERIVGFESFDISTGINEVAMMVRVWIEVPALGTALDPERVRTLTDVVESVRAEGAPEVTRRARWSR